MAKKALAQQSIGKKCIPGIMCIENMTLFIFFVLAVLISYFIYNYYVKPQNANTQVIVVSPLQTQRMSSVNLVPMQTGLMSLATRNDPFNDPYAPPLKADGLYFPPDSGDVRGIPINMRSRGMNTSYSQVGILTRKEGSEMILPLMGRRNTSGRDKWQYYTISNTGNLNTKLPIKVKGRSCTGEYGCDEVYDGDIVYVEGYKETFYATVYENGLFQYIPF